MTTTSHFILIHGAWHQPDHWTPLVNLLESSGHSTSAPKLPSASASPPPNVFNADIAAIKGSISQAVAQGATTVVPVLHSYGGIPGFEALATLTPEEKAKVSRVVCISAFIVPKGGSLAGAQQRDDSQFVKKDGPLLTMIDPIPFFYNDVAAPLAAHASLLLLPQAVEAFAATTQHDGCAEFRVTYVVCDDDKALSVEYQKQAIEVCRSRESRLGGRDGVEVVEMQSGHSPFLSQTEEMARVLLRAAGVRKY